MELDIIKFLNDEKNWIQEVSENSDKYINSWINDYKNGIISKDDIIQVVKKIAKYKNDTYIVKLTLNKIDSFDDRI